MNLIKPQLAIEYGKVKNLDLSQGYYASPKLDGIRCIILDGVAYSRSMKPIRNKEVQKFAYENKEVLQGMDGELISGSPTDSNVFRTTTSVVMSEDGGLNFTFYVFDNVKMGDEYFAMRYRVAEGVLQEANLDNVVFVKHTLIYSEEELLALEKQYLEEGYEGIMLNSRRGYYKQGRSGTKDPELIKKKLFSDSEFKVIGYDCLYSNQNAAKINELGNTARSTAKEGLVPMEKLGRLQLITEGGRKFFCGSGFDDTTRVLLWKERDALIGKIAKLKYFAQGEYDSPRFPIFLGFRSEDDM